MATLPTPNRTEITNYLGSFGIDSKRVREDFDEVGYFYFPDPYKPNYGGQPQLIRQEWPKEIDLKLLNYLIGGGTREDYKPAKPPVQAKTQDKTK